MTSFAEHEKLGVPSVHLNGTSRGELIRQYREMHNNLLLTLKAFADATPHGRDYYVQGDNAYKVARDKMDRRYKVLADLLNEIETDYVNFDRANPEPEKRKQK